MTPSSVKLPGSRSSKAGRLPGFVSYQIPNGGAPSDNITLLDPRRYSSSVVRNNRGQNGYHRHHYRRRDSGAEKEYLVLHDHALIDGGTYEDRPDGRTERMHASIHPANLHNGGRPFSVQLGTGGRSRGSSQPDHQGPQETSESRHGLDYAPPPWKGEKYPRSPAPKHRVPDIDEDCIQTLDPSNLYNKPPLHPDDLPKPPPRSRPRSWTSTLFNAFKNGTKNNLTLPPSLHTSASYSYDPTEQSNNNTLDRRQAGPKQVRFLANPSRNIEPGQRFYSLPRFIQPMSERTGRVIERSGRTEQATVKDGAKTKGRSRTPSPFGRLFNSLVRGNHK